MGMGMGASGTGITGTGYDYGSGSGSGSGSGPGPALRGQHLASATIDPSSPLLALLMEGVQERLDSDSEAVRRGGLRVAEAFGGRVNGGGGGGGGGGAGAAAAAGAEAALLPPLLRLRD